MKSWHIPAIVYGTLAICFLGFVAASASLLPAGTVATHFNGAGQADGWMSRDSYLLFIAAMGLGLSLFMIGIMYACSFFPDRWVNLPYKQYWLAPPQRASSYAFLFAHSFWLASLILLLMAGMHYLTILANRVTPSHLPGVLSISLLVGFLLGIGVWCLALFLRFRKPT